MSVEDLARVSGAHPSTIRDWLEEEYPRLQARAQREGVVIYWGDETAVKEDSNTWGDGVWSGNVAVFTMNHDHILSHCSQKCLAKLILELHQTTDLDIGHENHSSVLLKKRGETFQDERHQLLWNSHNDHDQHIIFVKHDMPIINTVTALSGKIADNGVSLYTRTI